ncbi:MAG TPA: hypothetical protein VEZ72_00595 [Paenibacillus sp.]|nr:hypothetical protein [Paenibacillus sp.]
MVADAAAVLFAILTGIVVLFQLALAAGMPWGSLAMGGKFPGTFPPAMRAAAVAQAAVLALLAVVVGSRASLLLPGWGAFSSSAVWFVVAFSAVGTVMNLITPSKRERIVWAPVTLLMLISSVLVALGPR